MRGARHDKKKKKNGISGLPSNRKKPEQINTSSAEIESSHMDEMTSRQNVISPPPDMRELVNDITKSLDTPTDELDHPLSPGKNSVDGMFF